MHSLGKSSTMYVVKSKSYKKCKVLHFFWDTMYMLVQVPSDINLLYHADRPTSSGFDLGKSAWSGL